ncbi:hypothetical protein PanWU01x14_080200 [Parasponia andersonii]|uniref:Uncharacterized protein n=1 Tax=Parasponia andersonii TaxID=3476 RepID=A0A2P5DBH0_PARAD|nr:hypothetical protein PanWU01x14_080200 [Parasponia andersonii]
METSGSATSSSALFFRESPKPDPWNNVEYDAMFSTDLTGCKIRDCKQPRIRFRAIKSRNCCVRNEAPVRQLVCACLLRWHQLLMDLGEEDEETNILEMRHL